MRGNAPGSFLLKFREKRLSDLHSLMRLPILMTFGFRRPIGSNLSAVSVQVNGAYVSIISGESVFDSTPKALMMLKLLITIEKEESYEALF